MDSDSARGVDRRRVLGWVGVVLGNYDNVPLQEITEQEKRAITGQS